MLGVMQARKGVRLQGPRTLMAAAGNANAVAIFQQSTFAGQVGTRTFRLKRIKGLNAAGANTDIHIGTGAAGAVVDAIVPLHTFNGLNFDFVENDLPEVEFSADMMCYPDAASVHVQVEVEELG